MFSFQDNVPEYYLKESRDFQLFPRLDDILFLGIHQDISTITELNNPKKCKNNYLKYLAEKVGFYTDEYIPDKVLINIIGAFRTALKNKGTLLGIEQAVIAILKAENSVNPPMVKYVGESDTNYWDSYTINIYTPVKILNKVALKEFLKYIIPAGHNYNIYTYDATTERDALISTLNTLDQINIVKSPYANIGNLRSYNDDKQSSLSPITDNLLGAVDLGIVVSGDDLAIDSNGYLETSGAKKIFGIDDNTTENLDSYGVTVHSIAESKSNT